MKTARQQYVESIYTQVDMFLLDENHIKPNELYNQIEEALYGMEEYISARIDNVTDEDLKKYGVK